jgi:hypothetical protein
MKFLHTIKHSFILPFSPPKYFKNSTNYSNNIMPTFFTACPCQATPSTIPLVNLRPPLLSPAAASTESIMISNTSHLSNTPTINLIIQPPFIPTHDTMTSLYVYNQLLCPNVNCNIGAPHFYDQEHVPSSLDHRQLALT